MTPLRTLFNFGSETAAFMFNKMGYLKPMWIGVNNKGAHLPLIVRDMSDKDKVAADVRAFLKKEGAVRYVSMLESWLGEFRKGEVPLEILAGGQLEHHPDRREIISIIAEDNEGKIISGRFYILRPEHDKPKLSPIKVESENTESMGRFAGMFR
jgi:hypothetical protein